MHRVLGSATGLVDVAAVLFVWVAWEVGRGRGFPEAKRQIPAETISGRTPAGAFRFAVELGTGLRTYLPSASPYLLAACLLMSRLQLLTAVLLGAGFGVGRSLELFGRLVTNRRSRYEHTLGKLLPFEARVAGPIFVVAALGIVVRAW